jgi:uncharacterized protein
MSLFPKLQPDLVLGGSVLAISPEFLRDRQIEGLILDVDDTIVPIKSEIVTPELSDWLKSVSQVAKVCLVTNNPKGDRIARIADRLSLPYYFRAGKPSRRKMAEAVTAMNLSPDRMAMVGDRVFTDVLAGNRMGMFTILIEPIAVTETSTSFRLLRQVEFTLARALGVSLGVG